MRPPRPRPCDAAPPRKANPLAAVDGGTEALGSILSVLPDVSPGIVIVQHMPAAFTAGLASRLDKLSALEVIEGRDGDEVRRGRAIIAPGDRHLRIRSRGGRFEVVLGSDEPVNRHKPSVDVLPLDGIPAALLAASMQGLSV